MEYDNDNPANVKNINSQAKTIQMGSLFKKLTLLPAHTHTHTRKTRRRDADQVGMGRAQRRALWPKTDSQAPDRRQVLSAGSMKLGKRKDSAWVREADHSLSDCCLVRYLRKGWVKESRGNTKAGEEKATIFKNKINIQHSYNLKDKAHTMSGNIGTAKAQVEEK
jgi:hypothetical protein